MNPEEESDVYDVYQALRNLMSHLASRPGFINKLPLRLIDGCTYALQQHVANELADKAEGIELSPSRESVRLLNEWYKLWVSSDLPSKLPDSLHTRTAVFLAADQLRRKPVVPMIKKK